MTDKEKQVIDNMSYEQMLSKWRFAPIGDSYLQGERGKYFSKVLARKRDADPDAAVAASKAIGWNR